MSTFSYLVVYCVHDTIQLVLQACFVCSTNVSLLIFYGLFKINWHAKFLFHHKSLKHSTAQEKCVISKKQKFANYVKTADSTKKVRSFSGSAHQKT